jgi:hypothetical protein
MSFQIIVASYLNYIWRLRTDIWKDRVSISLTNSLLGLFSNNLGDKQMAGINKRHKMLF